MKQDNDSLGKSDVSSLFDESERKKVLMNCPSDSSMYSSCIVLRRRRATDGCRALRSSPLLDEVGVLYVPALILSERHGEETRRS